MWVSLHLFPNIHEAPPTWRKLLSISGTETSMFLCPSLKSHQLLSSGSSVAIHRDSPKPAPPELMAVPSLPEDGS